MSDWNLYLAMADNAVSFAKDCENEKRPVIAARAMQLALAIRSLRAQLVEKQGEVDGLRDQNARQLKRIQQLMEIDA